MKVAFIDRDGTLIWEPPDTKQVDSLDKLTILPGVVDGLKILQSRGYNLVMASNQDGLGTENFPQENFDLPQRVLLKTLKKRGIIFDKVFISADLPKTGSLTRKPKTGLVDWYIAKNNIDVLNSLVIGDRESDRQFARELGAKFIKVITNKGFLKINGKML